MLQKSPNKREILFVFVDMAGRLCRDVVRHSFAEGGNAHISVARTIPASGANKWTWDVPLNETDYNDELKLGGE